MLFVRNRFINFDDISGGKQVYHSKIDEGEECNIKDPHVPENSPWNASHRDNINSILNF